LPCFTTLKKVGYERERESVDIVKNARAKKNFNASDKKKSNVQFEGKKKG